DPPAPAPKGNLSKARAHWISANTVAWKTAGLRPDWNVKLSYAVHGSLALGADGVGGGVSIPLTYDPAGLSDAQRARFPHLASYAAFHLPADRLSEVRAALEGQLAVSATDAGGASTDATGVQVPGVLDDLFAYDGPLGASFASGVPTLRLWAPTARSVR